MKLEEQITTHLDELAPPISLESIKQPPQNKELPPEPEEQLAQSTGIVWQTEDDVVSIEELASRRRSRMSGLSWVAAAVAVVAMVVATRAISDRQWTSASSPESTLAIEADLEPPASDDELDSSAPSERTDGDPAGESSSNGAANALAELGIDAADVSETYVVPSDDGFLQFVVVEGMTPIASVSDRVTQIALQSEDGESWTPVPIAGVPYALVDVQKFGQLFVGRACCSGPTSWYISRNGTEWTKLEMPLLPAKVEPTHIVEIPDGGDLDDATWTELEGEEGVTLRLPSANNIESLAELADGRLIAKLYHSDEFEDERRCLEAWEWPIDAETKGYLVDSGDCGGELGADHYYFVPDSEVENLLSLYAIFDADGSGLRRVAGPGERDGGAGAVQLVGTADEVTVFTSGSDQVSTTTDGLVWNTADVEQGSTPQFWNRECCVSPAPAAFAEHNGAIYAVEGPAVGGARVSVSFDGGRSWTRNRELPDVSNGRVVGLSAREAGLVVAMVDYETGATLLMFSGDARETWEPLGEFDWTAAASVAVAVGDDEVVVAYVNAVGGTDGLVTERLPFPVK